MELLAIGASAFLASALVNKGAQPEIDPPTKQMFQTMLETPREGYLHELRERGAFAPSSVTSRGRLPWDERFPPYYVSQTAPGGPNEQPVERLYTLLANGIEHERQDVQEEFSAARTHYARKRGAAPWFAFNDELHITDVSGEQRPTNRLGFQWMPPNPTDTDWNEAGLFAKALPGDPTLFTPDSTWMTNSGMPFRNGARPN